MGAIGDIIVSALKELLEVLFSPIKELIEKEGDAIVSLVVNTPHPNSVFSPPTNDPWPALYDYYWETWIPIMLFLWAATIGLVIFFESTSHLFGSYHRSKLKRRAFSGLLGLLSWWWIAALSLRFIDALTGVIVPNLSDISLFETLSFSAMGVLGLVVALSLDLILFILIGIIYVMRQVVLYLFVLLMPLLIVLWIPGVGPFGLASRFMRRLAGFYVPFLFMTIPVALLFRLGDIIGTNFGVSLDGFGAWVIALIIPLIAVISPFVLFWQAGALFFMADRAASHASRRRAQARIQATRERGRQTKQGTRNFARALRGEPAVRENGQVVIDSGGSRTHAVGARLRSSGSRLRGVFGPGRNGSGRRGGGGDTGRPELPRPGPDADRSEDFENLRDQPGSDSQRGTDPFDPDETDTSESQRGIDPFNPESPEDTEESDAMRGVDPFDPDPADTDNHHSEE